MSCTGHFMPDEDSPQCRRNHGRHTVRSTGRPHLVGQVARPLFERRQGEVSVTAIGEQVVEAVDGGEDFGAAAEAAGAAVSEPKLLTRQETETDQLVVFEVFAVPKPTQDSPVMGRVRGLDGAYTVYSLDAVLPGRPESTLLPSASSIAGTRRRCPCRWPTLLCLVERHQDAFPHPRQR